MGRAALLSGVSLEELEPRARKTVLLPEPDHLCGKVDLKLLDYDLYGVILLQIHAVAEPYPGAACREVHGLGPVAGLSGLEDTALPYHSPLRGPLVPIGGLHVKAAVGADYLAVHVGGIEPVVAPRADAVRHDLENPLSMKMLHPRQPK